MRVFQRYVVVLGLLGFCLTLIVIGSNLRKAAPAPPQLSSNLDPAMAQFSKYDLDKAIDYYEREFESKPQSGQNAVILAQLYLQAGRLTGKEREFVVKAEAAVSRAPDKTDSAVLLTRATIQMHKHQFAEGLALASAVLALEPQNLRAFAIAIDAQVELGHYGTAVDLCDRMLRFRPDIRSYSRAAYLRQLHGLDEAAFAAMKLAWTAGAPGSENRIWARFQIGDMLLDSGAVDEAARVFADILKTEPEHIPTLTAMAEARILQGVPRDAVALLLYAYERVPNVALLVGLVDAQKAAGLFANAKRTQNRVAEGFQRFEASGWTVDLEWAEFNVNHDIQLSDALTRAKRAFQRRPGNIEAMEILAMALFKNGLAREALPLIESAMGLGIRDAVLYRRASAIARELGLEPKADRYEALAQEMNPVLASRS